MGKYVDRTGDIAKIISEKPGWISRWGITILLGITLLLGIIYCLFQEPIVAGNGI